MASTPPTLGTRIRRARERARLSQEELAQAVDASVRAVGDWENDRRKPRNRLGALEDALGVSLDENEEEPELPTPEELDDLRRHAVEVLGENAGPFLDALDAAVSGVPLTRRGRGSAGGRSSGRLRAAGSS
jgi:transcriptional regulator with XRE-family HTH domain